LKGCFFTTEYARLAGTSVDIGFGPGQGRTINVNWAEKLSTGDAEYVAAMRSVVSPVLKSFRPDCIVLRTNFGSHNLTPAGYAYIVHLLYRAAHGRVCMGCICGNRLPPFFFE
jgi:acetoin utilization deacetylase AcuC-like enzyme